MADLYTGKYLDGAGLQILWNKLKVEYAKYAKLDGDNTLNGVNTFAQTIVVPGVKTAAGDNTKLFADGGGFVNVSDFATAGHNHDAVYVNVTGDTMTGDLTIGSSEAAANLTVYGTGTFSDYVTAKGFKVGVQTGFLKADGSVDTNIYALKSDFDNHNHDAVYARLAADNTLTGANVFTHVDGVKAKKFVVDGGLATDLLLANGDVKPVSYFATSAGLTAATDRITTIEGNYIKKDGSVAMEGGLTINSTLNVTGKSTLADTQVSTFEATGAATLTTASAQSITLSSAITADAQATTKKYVDDEIGKAIDTAINNLGAVLEFKGSVSKAGDLPTSAALGDVWVVAVAGTYAGEVCEVGDMLICTVASETAPTWTIIQRNIPGVLTESDINAILV